MAVIKKENVELLEQGKQVGDVMGKYWALKEEHEKTLDAKDQAIKMNIELENELRRARKEISRLNSLLEEKEKLYKKALDESVELEKMKQALLRLVHYFVKQELGL